MDFRASLRHRGQTHSVLVSASALLVAILSGCSANTNPNPGPGDPTPPTVSVSGPLNGATVSAQVPVSADASDNVAVAGVQFLLDGNNLGTEVTSAPFSTSWNTTLSTNAAHVLSARARDAAGNAATSAMVNVTVSNTLPPLQLELVPMPTGGALFASPLDLQAPVEAAGVPAGRLFVAEQGGLIRIIQNGAILNPAFLDVTGRSGFVSGGEVGLLGFAFHPQYATNRKFYVNYTSNTGGLHTVIAEFTASSTSFADPSSERILLTVAQPETNHNGGGLAFGNDGFLYIGLGDGGGGGDMHGTIGNGQDTGTLLGKILRIGVNMPFAPGLQYAIPPTNPFLGANPGRDEIWLYGLRNPFRFSIDQPTGNLWIGDVGQSAFEEVDLLTPQQKGANLGWRCKEGKQNFNFAGGCLTAALTDPIFDYDRSAGDETVIGGYVYHGTAITQLAGFYVFGDFISGRIWTLTQNLQGQWVRTQVAGSGAGGFNLSALGQGQNGELYAVGYSSGVISHIHQVGTP